jgi:peptidoglycan/xylan/chitin deacetylase (PgdA/CDA1 family)
MNKAMLAGAAVAGALACYYYFKPLIPQRLRYALRRNLAARVRRQCAAIWPIRPGTETPPANWAGWPDGKRFAFVLTHDVEGRRGLECCPPLMALEERHGFRSSFNFVPEGEYSVPPELRAELTRRGFEVGVHDLHHDGKLFRSREKFREHARRINQYMADWHAHGFRAGFMLHRLEWQRELKVLYDASTFDVDPFEPQPDGAGTIFPFWVGSDDEDPPGFMELPYTLVQDSTLFLLLREQSIDVWKRKLEWVAQHGGMALLITHPDYMDFSSDAPTWNRYPAQYYSQLLEHVSTTYRGQYWHALPHEVAAYCKKVRSSTSSRPLRSGLDDHDPAAAAGAAAS